MPAITTHVLDLSRGYPAAGVRVALEQGSANEQWRRVGDGVTDGNGRLSTLLPASSELAPGIYRLSFETGAYFQEQGLPTFFPHVVVMFVVSDTSRHYHVPILVSPFGYSTYRGS